MGMGITHRGYQITRHGARWRARVRLADRRVVVARDTPGEVAQALDVLLAERATQSAAGRASSDVDTFGPGHLTVAQLCDAWFAWKTSAGSDEPIRPQTRHDYRYAIDRYITPLIGLRDAAVVSSADLRRDFFRVCTSRTKARFARTVLRQAFRWAIEQRLVARGDNPAADVVLARRSRHDGRARKATNTRAVTDAEIPSAAEVQKMLAWALEYAADRHLRDWWLWLYVDARLGLRPAECTALRVEDLDRASGVVRVRRAVPTPFDPGDWYVKTETSVRDLEVDDRFFDDVEPHLPRDGWLFPSDHPRARIPTWSAWTPSRKFARMRAALDLPGAYHPYSMRHFTATRLILLGVQDIQVAKFLGTSSLMLHKTYANHLDREAQRCIGAKVMQMF